MSHQKGRLKNSKFWLCLSLILCLVSAIVASAVQTSGGIRIKEMSWESPSGHQLAAYLYIPQNATKDTPAPGVVTIEGWYNKHRRSGNPCIFRGSRLFCYYRVISSVFNGL